MKTVCASHSPVLSCLIFLALPAALLLPRSTQGQARDLVGGNLIQFNDNGAWTWYSDERAIVDPTGGKLVVGSDATPAGLGGTTRNGSIEATLFDLPSGTSQRAALIATMPGGPDDHNGPAFLVRPDGKYLAQWTGHNANYLSYFRIYDGTNWGSQTTFDWTTVGASQQNELASYSNPHYLPAEKRTYTFVRCMDNHSPWILMSTNYGDTWSFYGKLVRSFPGAGYNPGYFRYSDNGSSRIDFICTEAHPRDYLTSIYHGYVSNGMSFKTDGTVVDSDLTNTNNSNVPFSYNFTPVFTNGTIMPPGMTNFRCWNDDVQCYVDGTIECIISARINQSLSGSYPFDTNINPNHAFIFCRYDRTNWTFTYLCQAGYKMYSSEADYVGLGCLSPNDPNTIYVSTAFDPRAVVPGLTDTNPQYSANREIWQGVTTNHGASFAWRPITQNSVRDNFRPLVPAWTKNDTALIWFRGTYLSAQSYDAAPVGIVEHRSEVVGQMHYVDATAGAGGNTTLTNGSTLVLSSGANQWHLQTGVGNGGTVISSADSAAENATNLMTQATVPGPGTYDVWVNFWGMTSTNEADWRIKAGLTVGSMQTYRSEKCEEVQPWTQDTSLVLTNTSPTTNYLYQAYVGRVVVSNNYTINVLVDDNAIQTGGDGSTLVGNTNRTWYDGISYAKVEPFQIQKVYRSGPSAMTLVWNSPPSEMSLTTPTYTVQKTSSLVPPISWTNVVTGIPAMSKAYATTNVDNSATDSAAFYRVTWP